MKSTVKLNQPVRFYVPITRVDPETRIVEGYCYVNPTIAGDRWNLKRSALEAASGAYMEAPAIRAMHQNIAAGVGLGLNWDDKGCLLRAEIVDDQEWKKVEKGVYRGFSIGGRPKIVRGNSVESFDWLETSLVDRPGDPDATFSVARLDGADEAFEVEVDDAAEDTAGAEEPATGEAVERGMDSTAAPARENLEGGDKPDRRKIKRLTRYAHPGDENCLHLTRDGAYECMAGNIGVVRAATVAAEAGERKVMTFADFATVIQAEDKRQDLSTMLRYFFDCMIYVDEPEALHQSMDEFADAVHAWIDGEDVGDDEVAETARVARLAAVEVVRGLLAPPAENPGADETVQRLTITGAEMLQRAETAEASLTIARADLEAATTRLSDVESEVQRLRALPTQSARPVQFPSVAAQRSFAANLSGSSDEAEEAAGLLARRQQLLDESGAETDSIKRGHIVQRLIAVEAQLTRLGIDPNTVPGGKQNA